MRRYPILGALIGGILCIGSVPAVFGDTYKVVDEETGGETIIADTPPENRSVTVSDYPPGKAPSRKSAATKQSEEVEKLVKKVDRLTLLLEENRRVNAPPSSTFIRYIEVTTPTGDEWKDWLGPQFILPGAAFVGRPFKHGPHEVNKFQHGARPGSLTRHDHRSSITGAGSGLIQSAPGFVPPMGSVTQLPPPAVGSGRR